MVVGDDCGCLTRPDFCAAPEIVSKAEDYLPRFADKIDKTRADGG